MDFSPDCLYTGFSFSLFKFVAVILFRFQAILKLRQSWIFPLSHMVGFLYYFNGVDQFVPQPPVKKQFQSLLLSNFVYKYIIEMDVIITDSEVERRSTAETELDLPTESLGKMIDIILISLISCKQ